MSALWMLKRSWPNMENKNRASEGAGKSDKQVEARTSARGSPQEARNVVPERETRMAGIIGIPDLCLARFRRMETDRCAESGACLA